MFNLNDYSTELESYLTEMKNELDKFQKTMTDNFSKIKKEEYFDWYLNNNDPIKTSSILSYSVNMKNDKDTNIARQETLKKHIETMNVFYCNMYGVSFFKNL